MKNKIIIQTVVSFFVFLSSNEVRAGSFKYQIKFPDNEVKTFVVAVGRSEIKLNNSKWKCAIDTTLEEKNKTYSTVFDCSIPGTQTSMAQFFFCSKSNEADVSMNMFILYDKGRKHSFAVQCNSRDTW